MSREAYLERTASMLADVFGGTRYSKNYLEWQYERSPAGREIAVDIERDEEYVAGEGLGLLAGWAELADRHADVGELQAVFLAWGQGKSRGHGAFRKG